LAASAQTERASGFASDVKRGIGNDAERFGQPSFDGRREIVDFVAAERYCTRPIAKFAPAC
jgi:hypothetical protein